MGDDSVLRAFVRLEPYIERMGIINRNGVIMQNESAVQSSAEEALLKLERG
jgi:hypothetical protein